MTNIESWALLRLIWSSFLFLRLFWLLWFFVVWIRCYLLFRSSNYFSFFLFYYIIILNSYFILPFIRFVIYFNYCLFLSRLSLILNWNWIGWWNYILIFLLAFRLARTHIVILLTWVRWENLGNEFDGLVLFFLLFF